MSHASLMVQIARTDAAFAQQGDTWVGRCLICGGPLRFEALTGAGATIEHILPRSLGGTNDLSNLGIAHRRCNGEKGRRWIRAAIAHAKSTMMRCCIVCARSGCVAGVRRIASWRNE